MLVRALKTTCGTYGTLPRHKTGDIPDWEAKDLIRNGYAVAVGPVIVPQVREAKTGGADATGNNKSISDDKPEAREDTVPFTKPSPARQTGGQTGEEKPASSSRAGRPRRSQTLTSPKDDAAA